MKRITKEEMLLQVSDRPNLSSVLKCAASLQANDTEYDEDQIQGEDVRNP